MSVDPPDGLEASASTHDGGLKITDLRGGGRRIGKTSSLEAVTQWAIEAEERQRVRELLRDPEISGTIRDMQGKVLELSQGAIRDPKVMQQWKEMFPDICPGCFGLHSRMIPYLKGLCTGCRLKLSEAQKQL